MVDEELQHGMNCWGNTPGRQHDCTCGLEYRKQLSTERSMHNAWRKRAEEAEKELQQAKARRQTQLTLQFLINNAPVTIEHIKSATDFALTTKQEPSAREIAKAALSAMPDNTALIRRVDHRKIGCLIHDAIKTTLTKHHNVIRVYDAIKPWLLPDAVILHSDKNATTALIRQLVDSINVFLGHNTGGLDGDWRDCNPIEIGRNALSAGQAYLQQQEGK